MGPDDALLAASALHAGFQAVVTIVVYPALADVPDEQWASAHAAHTRRITVVVAPLYLVVAAACLWALLSGPSAAAAVAMLGNAVAAATTAFVAAPAHGRLGRDGRSPALLRRLLRADRVRFAGAVVGAVAAALAV